MLSEGYSCKIGSMNSLKKLVGLQGTAAGSISCIRIQLFTNLITVCELRVPLGVYPTLTLVANSSSLELKGDEAGVSVHWGGDSDVIRVFFGLIPIRHHCQSWVWA
jgi:hypothetical protein